MPRDSQTKMSMKESNKSKKREEDAKRKKKNSESSDDDASFYSDDDDDEMDVHEYRKFLKKMFPSKHLDKKIKAGEKLKKAMDEDEEVSEEEEEIESPKKKTKKLSKKLIKKQKKVKEESEEEDDSEEEEEEIKPKKKSKKPKKKIVVSDDEDEESDEDLGSEDDEEEEDNPKAGKFNIIFTIGGRDEDDEFEDMFEDDEEWETCSDSQTENEDDPISSDSEEDEDEEREEEEEEEKSSRNKRKSKQVSNKEKKIESKKDKQSENIEKSDKSVKKEEDFKGILDHLMELKSKNPNDKSIDKCIEVYETEVKVQKEKKEKKVKKEKARNGRIFKRILRDKNTMNDFEFYDKLEIEQQKKIIKELREINKITRIEKPYRLTLLESDIPVIFKAAAMKKISSLRYMEPGSGEYYKIKNWVDTFMRIPFSKNETLPLSITDGVDKCHDFMANAQKTLDEAVYGLNDAKMQIMQMLGQLITNPKAVGSAIAIHGPPGTGKTSLVKEGISKILNRPFAFIALGGATDSSFLEGHGYTYEGSTWGKIVQILIDSKCMNPVIYFDELDKISDTPKGEEIAGILTHLTDTSQNTQFHDKYFAEIDFDLSKCLFIFSYNDESKVNPILKDRMYRIQTKGYNQNQKTAIANNYLLPKIRDQVKFMSEDIIIPDQTLHYMIEHHCNKEDGVRNLKRCLEIIYTKLNLYRLMRPGSNLFEEDMSLKVQFPFTVTKDIVDKLVKKSDNGLSPSLYMLYT
jgi:ATP-dependent Lon protease